HVPAEDIPPNQDLFARGELGARLRELAEPRFTLVATGDTMLAGRTRPMIARHGWEDVFKMVRPLLRRGDVGLGHLEGPLAAEAARLPRNFAYRVDPRLALALRRAGLLVMSVANNHITDCGPEGVLETLEVLRRAGIAPLGGGENERAAHQPVIREA